MTDVTELVSVPLTMASAVLTANTAPAMGRINQYDASAGALTPPLLALSGLRVGARTAVQKSDSSGETVTFTCAGADTLADGGTTLVLRRPGDQCELQVVAVGATKKWKVAGSSSAVVPVVDAGSFPWPAGLVGLFHFQHDAAGGKTVTSRVGSQPITLRGRNNKTVVKDANDPGPFGPSLVLDGATAFVKDGNIGALDVSTTGNQVTLINWVKDSVAHDEGNAFTERFRAGSHCEAGLEGTAQPSRQYGSYFDAALFIGVCGHYTPHVEFQDGPSPHYPWSHDHAASHRKYSTGTGYGQWHMEAFTFDGAEIVAYVDGMSDIWRNVPEPAPSTWGATVLSDYVANTVDRNPYQQEKGINRSQTMKRFSIGGVVFGYPPNFDAGNFTSGRLGGVAVFNRALKPEEIMQIRLATLLPGEPITMFGFEVSALGQRPLDEIGWSARANASNDDVSLAFGNDYRISRGSTATKASLRKSTTTIGAAWGPVTGLESSMVKRLRFKMLSDATTSAAQRLLVKVGSKWWASNATYVTTSAHLNATDWAAAELKTHTVDWDIGNWLAVTMDDTGGTTTYQNLAKNPALTVNATGWAVSSQSPHATGARVSDGAGGFVYRLTWTGADAHGTAPGQGGTASLLNSSGIGAVTPGTYYSASMVVAPSKNQHLALEMYWYNSSGTFISADTGVSVLNVLANTPTTLSMSAVAPAGAAQLAVRVITSQFGGVDWANGDTLDVTKAMITSGSSPAYFDGSYPGASWDGTAGASTSSKTVVSGALSLGAANAAYIKNAMLTAVGFLSSGGDGSVVRVTDLELLPN